MNTHDAMILIQLLLLLQFFHSTLVLVQPYPKIPILSLVKAPFYSSFPSHYLLELMKIQNYKWFNLGDERWAFSREDYLLTVLDELGEASLTSILQGIT